MTSAEIEEDSSLTSHQKVSCPLCGAAYLNEYDVPDDLAKALYDNCIKEIIASLEKREGTNYPNVYLDLGALVAEGPSIFRDMYSKLIEDIAISEINKLSPLSQRILYSSVRYDIKYRLDEDAPVYVAIAEEFYERVCLLAEHDYLFYELSNHHKTEKD